MCRLTTYGACRKAAWKGCGEHIGSVKEEVPVGQWCDKDRSGGEYAAVGEGRGSFGSFCK